MKLLKKILNFLLMPACEYFAPPEPTNIYIQQVGRVTRPGGNVKLSEDGFATIELPQGLSVSAKKVDIEYGEESTNDAVELLEAIRQGLVEVPDLALDIEVEPELKAIYDQAFDEGIVNRKFVKECVKALRNTKVKKMKPFDCQDQNSSTSAKGFMHHDKLESLTGLGVIARVLNKHNLVKLVFPQNGLAGFMTVEFVRVSDHHDQGIVTQNILDANLGIENAVKNLEIVTAKGLRKSFVQADKTHTFKQLANGLERRYLG